MPIITPHRFRSKCTCLVEMHVFGGNARGFWNNLGIFGNKRFKISILHTVAEWLPTKSDCRSFEEVKCRQKPTAEVLKNRISHRVSSPTYTVENGSRRIVTSLGVNMSTATRSVGGTAHERHRLQQREIDPKVVALGAAILEKIKHLERRPPITLALIALNSALWYTPDLLLAAGSPRVKRRHFLVARIFPALQALFSLHSLSASDERESRGVVQGGRRPACPDGGYRHTSARQHIRRE